MPEVKMGFPEFSSVFLLLQNILETVIGLVLLKVLLSHALIHWHVLSINKVLSSHLLHSLQLSLLVTPSGMRIQLLLVHERLLVGCLIVNLFSSKLEVSFSKFVLSFLID